MTLAASQLRGLVAHPAVGRVLDREALSAYLTYGFVPAPLSLVAGVRKLRAGEVVRVGPDARLVSGRHGTLPPPAPEERPLEEWAPLVWQALGDTVSRHTADRRRVGVYLSGGWDSAALAQAVADAPLDEVLSFTLTYERAGHERTDPAQAAALAGRLGLRHHELVVRREDAPPEGLPALAVGLDEPVATFSRAYTGTLLARAAEREGIDVCLSGFSAEPVFGWYVWGDFLEARSGDGPPTLDEAVDHVGSGDSIATALQARLLVDPLRDPHALAVGLLRDHCAWSNAEHPCDIVTRAMLRMRTPELMLPIFDRTAAPHAVEVRHPYHDARLLAFAGRIPLPLRGSESPAQERATLKAAVAGRLPVPTGEKEAVPRYPWLPLAFDSERDGLLSPEAFARFGVFRPSVLQDVAEGRIRRGRRVLWSVLLIHAWLEAMRVGT
jgi:asparagine synthase (glutamine-hydrolysing)